MILNNLCCVVATLLVSIQFSTSAEAAAIVRVGEYQKEIFCHYEQHSTLKINEIITNGSECNHIVYSRLINAGEMEPIEFLGTNETDSVMQDYRKRGIRVSVELEIFYRPLFFTENLVCLAQSITEFLQRHNFDGIFIIYPDESSTQPRLSFIRQVSEALKPHGFLLSVLIRSKILVNPNFDVTELSSHVDWLILFGADPDPKTVKLFDPLYFYPGDAHPELTTNWTVNYLLEKGVTAEQIVLSVMTLSHTLQFSSEESVLNGTAKPINIREQFFSDACSKVKNDNLTVVHDNRVGTYAYSYHERIYTSYYDVGDAYSLGEYVVQKNLGGAAILLISYDDVNNQCGCGELPLYNGLMQGLRNVKIGKAENCT